MTDQVSVIYHPDAYELKAFTNYRCPRITNGLHAIDHKRNGQQCMHCKGIMLASKPRQREAYANCRVMLSDVYRNASEWQAEWCADGDGQEWEWSDDGYSDNQL